MPDETMTDRLVLRPIDPADPLMMKAVYAIQSDPATWTHLPEGVERDISQTIGLAERYARSWSELGLGWWVATLRVPLAGLEANTLIGLGGVGVRHPEIPAWNLGYRLSPEVWGHGLAVELSRAAIQAAGSVRPELPVTGRALLRNTGSWRVLEKAGLSLAWEGSSPVTAPLTAGLTLRIYGDRPLTGDLITALSALG